MTARILVVDDVASNVKLLEARLLAEYYEVVSAYNGSDAFEICLGGQIDVVLLDVLMPGMDGFEVCRKLKDDPRTSNIPVVMVTSLDRPEDKIRGLEAGADDFLSKPVNDLHLMSRVKSRPPEAGLGRTVPAQQQRGRCRGGGAAFSQGFWFRSELAGCRPHPRCGRG